MSHYSTYTTPWCTIGDFNVIIVPYEKLGGIPYDIKKSFEFLGVNEACGLTNIGFRGLKFTWSILRGIHYRIWKRLDRALIFDLWLEKMSLTTITHLPFLGFDCCPLLLEMKERQKNYIKYFKFLNCWVENPTFLSTVEACWQRPYDGKPHVDFSSKTQKIVIFFE